MNGLLHSCSVFTHFFTHWHCGHCECIVVTEVLINSISNKDKGKGPKLGVNDSVFVHCANISPTAVILAQSTDPPTDTDTDTGSSPAAVPLHLTDSKLKQLQKEVRGFTGKEIYSKYVQEGTLLEVAVRDTLKGWNAEQVLKIMV